MSSSSVRCRARTGSTPGRLARHGYKFAPWVGRVLAQLALQRGTVYDIGRFTPARFAAEGVAS